MWAVIIGLLVVFCIAGIVGTKAGEDEYTYINTYAMIVAEKITKAIESGEYVDVYIDDMLQNISKAKVYCDNVLVCEIDYKFQNEFENIIINNTKGYVKRVNNYGTIKFILTAKGEEIKDKIKSNVVHKEAQMNKFKFINNETVKKLCKEKLLPDKCYIIRDYGIDIAENDGCLSLIIFKDQGYSDLSVPEKRGMAAAINELMDNNFTITDYNGEGDVKLEKKYVKSETKIKKW